jgi:hypothetical protein
MCGGQFPTSGNFFRAVKIVFETKPGRQASGLEK